MLPYFPNPYPEELVYSVIARYLFYMGLSSKEFAPNVFGANQAILGFKVPGHITQLCTKTGIKNPEYLLYHNTAFKYYAAFQKQNNIDTIKKTLLCQADLQGFEMAWMRRNSVKSGINYCPECVKEDLEKYGEAYHHIFHCLDGVLYCPKHLVALRPYPNSQKTRFVHYIRFDPQIITSTNSTIENDEKHKKIARTAFQLMNFENVLSYEMALPAFKRCLQQQNYMTAQGKVRLDDLSVDIDRYYSLSNESSALWLRKLLIPYYQYHMGTIYYLMLIAFLKEDLFAFREEDYINITTQRTLKKSTNIDRAKRNLKRKGLLLVLKNNPSMTRSNLAKSYPDLYRYFLRYDRDFFEDNIPKRYVDHRKVNWKAEDVKYLRLCENIYNQDLVNGSARITKRLIAQFINAPSLLKYLDRMPDTKKFLDSICETHQAVRLRRFCDLAEKYYECNNVVPTVELLFRLKNCVGRCYFNEIKSALEDYLQHMIDNKT